ncbi:chromatin modification- protein VID21 [Pseudogymnoascus verrucosus]|uniref:Vacuolar import and degradation protein 21 n=1 Tax=Pseudogymnoascus verrucosus TaxID=342668 RepID=A0A1B8GRB9_9PEZI|nr:chromatin modification- protein VID21 [Pseudogymnoascus verrucosus]OBT98375.1 chromatin modification- protein VID21 [Pseudogymnoascus verrucosus]
MSNEVVLAGRKQLTTSRENDIDLIERSRKRKLRELYAVATCDGPIPLPAFLDLNAPISEATPAERAFLTLNDIKEGLILKEHTIPSRRRLRSDAPRASVGIDKSSLVSRASAPLDYAQRDGRESLQERPKTDASYNTGPLYAKAPATVERPLSRTTPPRGLQDGKAAGPRRKSIPREEALRIDRAVTTKVQTPTALLDAAVDETLGDAIYNANNPPAPTKDDAPTREMLEKDHVVKKAEATPDTPGVDPNVAIPKSAEDAAQLPDLIVNGANDPTHKPSTVHLPPQEAQEAAIKEREDQRHAVREERSVDTAAARLALEVPAQHERQVQADVASSPGSTVGPLSATTSAHHHETSADTSPDNEAHHYDQEVAEEKVVPETPPELAPTQEEVREKDAHDRILKSQIDVAREHILGSSPTAADTQLLEEQAAAASTIPGKEGAAARPAKAEVDGRQPEVRELAGAPETANELMDDEKEDQDEVVGVPTPDEKVPEPMPAAVEALKKETVPQPAEEVPEPMDVDVPEPAQAKGKEVEQAAPAPEPMDVTEPATTAPAKPEEPKEPSAERATSTAVSTPSIERMTTRVASGAMRHKSVSEILGETPRPSSLNTPERTPGRALAETDSNLPSGVSTPKSTTSRMRSLTERAREKERSKLSTVVFAKQPVTKDTKTSALISANAKPQGTEYPDYFMPLINAQSYTAIRGYQTLEALLASAHKTITTTNAALPFQEAQAQKIIRRIHSLQNHDKWSLRQPKRSPEPIRPTTHWDELLKEARWMRTDFREERKWKTALARRAAWECAMWVNGDQEVREGLVRKVKVGVLESVEGGEEMVVDAEGEVAGEANAEDEVAADAMVDTDAEVSHPTPDLVPSSDNDTPLDEFDDEPRISLLETVAPTAIFSLDNDDLVFGLSRSAASDKLLQELPMYGAPLKVHQSDLPTSEVDPDASWRKPYLPLSKYIEGKIRFTDEPPPRKKSRYEYAEESDDEDEVVFGERTQRKPQEPLQVDVALFNPENKHIRDRIHAGHQFRPPSEFPMPLQSFFENRHPSQWTWAEDDELKQLVREYQYNWSLISSMLTSKGVYYTAAERRTPWECFERWIHLEGLPADMQKTHYFRAYNSRLEAAQRSLLLQIQAQAAQPPPAVGSAPPRQIRRSTTSVRVERRRNQKHLTLVDSMRKVAKKRETTAQKQQQAQSLANMRKANDTPVQPINKHTPAQFSKIKHDREQAILEQKARLVQQQEAHRRAQVIALRNQQPNMQMGYPAGQNQQQRGNPNMNAPPPPNMGGNNNPQNRPANLSVPGQHHPQQQQQQQQGMQQLPNGMGAPGMPMPNLHPGMGGPMPLKGVPQQAQMGMQGMPMGPAHRLPAPNATPDLSLVMQAQRISQQQRAAVQMQQHQGGGGVQTMHSSPPNAIRGLPNMGGVPGQQQQGFMPTNGMSPNPMQQQQQQQHFAGSPPNSAAGVAGLQGSPRLNPQYAQLEASYRAKFPTATPEQVRKMVADALGNAQRQAAMHAAAGGGVQGMQGSSPVQYAQMLRAQQERQAAAVAAQGMQNQGQGGQQGQGQGQGQGQQGQGQQGQQGQGQGQQQGGMQGQQQGMGQQQQGGGGLQPQQMQQQRSGSATSAGTK